MPNGTATGPDGVTRQDQFFVMDLNKWLAGATYAQKMQVVFSSPAVLNVFKLQCDLFSQGRIEVGDPVAETHPLYELLKQPNFFQKQRQWLWDFMFWNMLGCASLYTYDRTTKSSNKLYWLDNRKVEFPEELKRKLDKLLVSQKSYNELGEKIITYRYEDNSTKNMKLKDITSFVDLTNGTGNWYGGHSSLDALIKVISNSERALVSQNTNLLFSGKYMVGGTEDNPYKAVMGEPERISIENKLVDPNKIITATSAVDIKRFVENYQRLKLEDSYLHSYYLIGKMYGIPRDVLEAYQSSTYENQEKARGAHVSYVLEPKGDDLCEGLRERLRIAAPVSMSWDHCSFMQVFEKERAEVTEIRTRSLTALVRLGADANEVGPDLGLDYEYDDTKQQLASGQQQTTEAQQGASAQPQEE